MVRIWLKILQFWDCLAPWWRVKSGEWRVTPPGWSPPRYLPNFFLKYDLKLTTSKYDLKSTTWKSMMCQASGQPESWFKLTMSNWRCQSMTSNWWCQSTTSNWWCPKPQDNLNPGSIFHHQGGQTEVISFTSSVWHCQFEVISWSSSVWGPHRTSMTSFSIFDLIFRQERGGANLENFTQYSPLGGL